MSDFDDKDLYGRCKCGQSDCLDCSAKPSRKDTRIAALEAENARLRADLCPICGYGAIVVVDEGTACCAYCSLKAERDAAQLQVSWSDAEVSHVTGPKGDRKSTGSDLPYPFPELLPRKSLSIKVRFDWTNKVPVLGSATLPGSGEGETLREIYVNMAAIFWAVHDDPELNWKELTAETLIHELLHHVQHELGSLVREEDVERALGCQPDNPDSTPQECDPLELTVKRAEDAEAEIRRLEDELDGGIRASTLRRLGGWIMDNAEYRRLVICEGGGQLEGWDDAERHDLYMDDGLDAALNAALDAAGAPKP